MADGSKRHDERAAGWLDAARAAGAFAGPAARTRLVADRNFASVRDTPAFRRAADETAPAPRPVPPG